MAARYGISVEDVGGATCLAVGALPDVTFFNRAIGLERDATGDDIEAIQRHFAGLGTSAFVSVSPDARPPGLAALLERWGFSPGYAWEKFTSRPDAHAQAQTDLRVERIDTPGPETWATLLPVDSGSRHSSASG